LAKESAQARLASQQLANGLMGYAEQDADIALGQTLCRKVSRRLAGQVDGVYAKAFGSLPSLPRSADFVAEGRLQDRCNFDIASFVSADTEMQRQQIPHHAFYLIQAARLGESGVREIIASNFNGPPTLAAACGCREASGRHPDSSVAACAQICSNVRKIPRAVYSAISALRGTSTDCPPR
jgi:hypothetical protein